jgi:tetratricopeptide (TPR) repeat protein
VTHEHLVIDRQRHRIREWDKFALRHFADGNNRSDKYTRDVALLRSGIQTEPDNARYHFYMGESYANMNQLENAIHWYKKRIAMGGWEEEVYYSMFQLARCTHMLLASGDDFDTTTLPLYMAAYHYRPTRLEALYQVVRFYFTRGQYTRAFGYGMVGYPACMSHTMPKDVLFLTHAIYTSLFPRLMEAIVRQLPRLPFAR